MIVRTCVLGDVGELDERPPARPVGRDLGLVEPAPVDVAEEVVLRPDGEVHALAGVLENAHPATLAARGRAMRNQADIGHRRAAGQALRSDA